MSMQTSGWQREGKTEPAEHFSRYSFLRYEEF